jgi:zinc transporter ZupT
LSSISLHSLLFLATAIAVLSAALGVWLTGLPQRHRRVVPFSAGLLAGIALFEVGPELAHELGWLGGLVLLFAGFALLWFINRYVYAVCPTCSHTHDHDTCSATLHGFALPLIAVAMLHSAMDGWGIAASRQDSGELGLAVFLGVCLHKIPEGLAYGAILRAALRSRLAAFGWCVIVEAPTMAGGLVESMATPHLGPQLVGVPLAIVGGSFLYLGFHAVHSEWRSRGSLPAFGPALTGAAGAALLHHGLHVLMG